MRLVTFNILHGRNPADDDVDLEIFRSAIAGLDADVLALQEVDRNQPRSRHADLTDAAAEAMGAVDHRFVAALSGSPGATWVAATGREQPDAAAYGIALLSRYAVTAWQIIRLPAPRMRSPMWFPGRLLPELVRDEPRVAVAATVETPQGVMTVVNTHLTFVPWWNGHQLRTLVRSVEGLPAPQLLVGDLNMEPARARRITGMHSMVDAATFPADEPVEQLDHVLTSGPGTPTAAASCRLPFSDHRALVVDLG